MEQARIPILRLVAGVAGAVLMVAAASPVSAQESVDSRWLPWLGCWEASGAAATDMFVCVRPAAGGVEVATVADNQIASTRTILADGQRHEMTEDGCTGWQSAAFSNDGRRVFLRSDRVCEGGVHRTASAIMGMTSTYEWLDAQSIGLGDERVPRAMRYRIAPTEIAQNFGFAIPSSRIVAASEARTLATMDLSLADVREAATSVDAEALEAFLIERDQPFDVNAAQIVALADAGVPDDVIDVVIAVSHPDRFQIDRDGMRTAMEPEGRDRDRDDVRDRYGYDPFGWGWYGRSRYGYGYGYGSCGYSYSLYDSLYCDRYGRGFGFGYGDPYWYGYTGRPVIIVRGDDDGDTYVPGRVVRGRGYTRGGSTASRGSSGAGGSGSTSRPPSAGSGSGSSSGKATATSGGYKGSGSSSAGSTSSGRTAKKKGGGS